MKSYGMAMYSDFDVLVGFCVQGIYLYILFKMFNRRGVIISLDSTAQGARTEKSR